MVHCGEDDENAVPRMLDDSSEHWNESEQSAGHSLRDSRASIDFQMDEDSQHGLVNEDSQLNYDAAQFDPLAPTQEDIDMFLSLPDYASSDVNNNASNTPTAKKQTRKRNTKKKNENDDNSNNNNNKNNNKRKFTPKPCPDFKKIPGTHHTHTTHPHTTNTTHTGPPALTMHNTTQHTRNGHIYSHVPTNRPY